MPLTPGTRPGGGLPPRMPPADSAMSGDLVRVKTKLPLELEYVEKDAVIGDDIAEIYDAISQTSLPNVLDGGNY